MCQDNSFSWTEVEIEVFFTQFWISFYKHLHLHRILKSFLLFNAHSFLQTWLFPFNQRNASWYFSHIARPLTYTRNWCWCFTEILFLPRHKETWTLQLISCFFYTIYVNIFSLIYSSFTSVYETISLSCGRVGVESKSKT